MMQSQATKPQISSILSRLDVLQRNPQCRLTKLTQRMIRRTCIYHSLMQAVQALFDQYKTREASCTRLQSKNSPSRDQFSSNQKWTKEPTDLFEAIRRWNKEIHQGTKCSILALLMELSIKTRLQRAGLPSAITMEVPTMSWFQALTSMTSQSSIRCRFWPWAKGIFGPSPVKSPTSLR